MPRHPRIVAKNPGFKPIGQGSSSLKKFFPGDEEDMDISSDMSVVADVDPPEPAPQPTTDVESRAQNDNQGSMPTSASAPDVSNDLPVPRRPSSPLAQSRGSSVVMEEEPPEPAHTLPQPSRPASPRLLTPRQPDLDPADNTGASTPSVQTRSELYAIVNQVGEGTFGKVYKAQNTVTKLHVALKRIRMESEKEGFPVTAMREIKLLQSLRHENVIRLYEMMVSNGSVYMVFEYMDHDLTGILSQTQFSFSDAHLKSLCHQMLAGLAYLHHKGVIHRDIKGSNILINNRGELKLGDFGLARFYQKRRRTDYTNRVITLWYRPPELLFGATIYGPEVDMWSAGCIMLELFTKKPVFQGNDEIHQLDTIYRVIGTPSPDRWPDVTNLPWYELVKSRDETPNHFREMFKKWMTPAALDLAEWLLCYNPAARATAVQAMDAPYFTQEAPVAEAPTGLATLHSEWHELDTKRERAKKRRRNDTVQ
ncbi:Pkinase-domain-containing protein [Mycena crocata]|nr:Pkinase-domain-containing protein [Mycena crocata]